MTFTASARCMGDGLRHEVDVNGRHLLVTDEPASLGGTDAGPAPHELLPAMLAACASTMVALYARRHGWELDQLTVDVEYDPEVTPCRCEVVLRLPDGLTADQVRRLERVAQTCPAKRALEAGFEFSQRTVAATGRRAAAAG